MMDSGRRKTVVAVVVALLAVAGLGLASRAILKMGRQPDGSFLVSTGQRIEGGSIAFNGRPIDLALHPTGRFFAVLNKSSVFLGTADGVRVGTEIKLPGANAGFRGLAWSPDGSRLFAGTDEGHVQEFRLDGRQAHPRRRRSRSNQPEAAKGNPVPGGLAITRDGSRMFVAAANLNAVVEVDLKTLALVRSHPVENLPFEPRLSEDEKTLVVSNWGGHGSRRPGEATSRSDALDIAVDDRNTATSGTRSAWSTSGVGGGPACRGRHPSDGHRRSKGGGPSSPTRWSDSDLRGRHRGRQARPDDADDLGQAPGSSAGCPTPWRSAVETLYVADGGDNADGGARSPRHRQSPKGFRPAGYFPTAIALTRPTAGLALGAQHQGEWLGGQDLARQGRATPTTSRGP